MKASTAKRPADPLPLSEGRQGSQGLRRSRSSINRSRSRCVWASIPKQADQVVRGSLVLPHGIGKSAARCVVFAKGPDNAAAAEAAGRRLRRWTRILRTRSSGRLDSISTSAIATPDMMGVGRPAWPRARPAGDDAVAASRDRHAGRGDRRGRRVQGGQGRVPGRQGRQRPRDLSASCRFSVRASSAENIRGRCINYVERPEALGSAKGVYMKQRDTCPPR